MLLSLTVMRSRSGYGCQDTFSVVLTVFSSIVAHLGRRAAYPNEVQSRQWLVRHHGCTGCSQRTHAMVVQKTTRRYVNQKTRSCKCHAYHSH
jgi:hypothetical protein